MPPQDDARERQMVDLFNLKVDAGRGRADVDAHLDLGDGSAPLPFELKSTTRGSVSTVRDFGPEHIAKWQDLHWLFAVYDRRGEKLQHCHYGSPADMRAWIGAKETYIRPDLVLADRAPDLVTDDVLTQVLGSADVFTAADARSVMKNQWTAEQYRTQGDLPDNGYSRARMVQLLQERCGYVIRRGSTLNNPHISEGYLAGLPRIENEHAATLRTLVRAYLASHDAQPPADLDPLVAAQAEAAGHDPVEQTTDD